MSRRFAFPAVFLFGLVCAAAAQDAVRPNILWITSEDNGPQLGCYGDDYADTPNIDGLATKGLLYRNCWSTAPVCAPARTTIISGLYPPSTGAEHMRSMTRLPAAFSMYPQYLREAGYYCTNCSKEDYNLEKPGKVWDESGKKAHWKNRGSDQPFFAIFNITTSHESQLRKRPHKAVHDPSKVRVPAYHPDTPEVRQDWAQYYDKMSEMDATVGKRLKELEQAGLAENTIIFYYGDHGSGMPRSKRWPYNSGLHVPLIIHVPQKYANLRPKDYSAGGETNRRVGFIDLEPTLLSLAGVEPPAHFQGHAFMGAHEAPPQRYQFGFRGRMDERYDMIRVARDERFIYIRNFHPHEVYGQHVSYMFRTPTTRVWKASFDGGNATPAQAAFWKKKPAEELYDLHEDRDEVNNLAGSSDHRATVERFRGALRDWLLEIKDVGFLPEDEIHSRSEDSTPYEMARDRSKFPFRRIFKTAAAASSLDPEVTPALIAALKNKDSAVRYWGAMGLLMRNGGGTPGLTALRGRGADAAWSVRVVAAETLARFGDRADLASSLDTLVAAANIEERSVYVAMAALNAIEAIGAPAGAVKDRLAALPRASSKIARRSKGYVPRLLDKILADLK